MLKSGKDCWWRRWIQEYLPNLTWRVKWCVPSIPLSVGTIVYVIDTEASRNQWKLGRVVKMYTGKNGIVRSVEVQTSNGFFERGNVVVLLISFPLFYKYMFILHRFLNLTVCQEPRKFYNLQSLLNCILNCTG